MGSVYLLKVNHAELFYVPGRLFDSNFYKNSCKYYDSYFLLSAAVKNRYFFTQIFKLFF